jgi:thymidylate synthase
MVNAWNVGELDQMVLPPCHYSFQVYTRELSDDEQRAKCSPLTPNAWDDLKEFAKLTGNSIEEAAKAANIPTRAISLMWNQRSVDTFLGLPFNIASYALLLEIIAKEVNMIPDELIGSLGDVHLYNNHIEQAKEQYAREPLELPKLSINDEFWNPEIGIIEQIQHIKPDDFQILNYQSHPAIKAPLSN